MTAVRRPSGEPPPLPRELNTAAVIWAAVFGFWALLWSWFFMFGGDDLGVWITSRDLELMRPIVANRQGWLTPAMEAVNSFALHLLVPLFGWTIIAGCVLTRRFRHLLTHLGVVAVAAVLWGIVAAEIQRPRPLGIDIIGQWDGFSQPSRPVALATVLMMGVALALMPAGTWRHRWYLIGGAGLGLLGAAQIYTGVDHPTDVAVSITMGVALSLLAFKTFVPEQLFPVTYQAANTAHLDLSGARGDAIRTAMARQLGFAVATIEPTALTGSAGSTPMRLHSADGDMLFAKLYARSHLRSDRWYKLGRTLLYGRLEDEHRFTSVRRLVQHEDYMLRVFRDAGIAAPTPLGIVEITPDREYLLVMEFLEDAAEISAVELSDETINHGIAQVRGLWDNGLAHRDIKPANLMVDPDGSVQLVDAAFAQVRPSPWRQAVDLANMMLVLALRSDPARVLAQARKEFSDNEMSEAFAASRGVTLPSQLRRDIVTTGRSLADEFRALLPDRQQVKIQRWSFRRAWLTVAVTAGTALGLLGTMDGLQDLGYLG